MTTLKIIGLVILCILLAIGGTVWFVSSVFGAAASKFGSIVSSAKEKKKNQP